MLLKFRMSRWTVLFSSVIPASGTRQIDKTFIKGLLTIQDKEHFKLTINANCVNNTVNHASLAIKRLLWLSVFTTLEPPYWMFSRISEVGPNRKLVPSTPRLSFRLGKLLGFGQNAREIIP